MVGVTDALNVPNEGWAEAIQYWHDGLELGEFGLPNSPTRPARRVSHVRPSEQRFVLGFPVRDGMGGISWIDTCQHGNSVIHPLMSDGVRGVVIDCGVLVNTIDVERACLDLLRLNLRPPLPHPGETVEEGNPRRRRRSP